MKRFLALLLLLPLFAQSATLTVTCAPEDNVTVLTPGVDVVACMAVIPDPDPVPDPDPTPDPGPIPVRDLDPVPDPNPTPDPIPTPLPGAEPYDLSAFNIPFSFSWPTEPLTNQAVIVTTMAELQEAVTIDANQITIPASFGNQSGDVIVTGSDIEVSMSNAATINGRLQIGVFGGSRVARLRWTGGNMTGGPFDMRNNEDILINNFHAITTFSTNTFTGSNFQRVAFINTTLEVIGGGAGGSWAFFLHQGAKSDLIFANVKMQGQGSQTNRIQQVTNLIIVDSSFNGSGAGVNGMRIHHETQNVYMADSTVVGGWLMDRGGVRNFIGERITTYGSNNQIATMHPENTGTYNDGPTFRDRAFAANGAIELDLGPFTGSNNIIQPWDSVPPGSGTIGADH